MPFKNPAIRIVLVFAVIFTLGTACLLLGDPDDAISIAQKKKAGILTSENVSLAFNRVSNRLVERLAQEGRRVKKGDVLLKLDDRDTAIELQKNAASLEMNAARENAQEIVLKNARTDYRRKLSLYQKNAVSRSVYEASEDALENAQAELAALRSEKKTLLSQKEALELEKSRLTLYASEDGKILSVVYQLGEIVPAGAAAVLLESDRQYFDIYVNETQAGKFSEGTRVEAFAPALGKNILATVRVAQNAPSFADLRMSREKGQSDLSMFRIRLYTEPTEGLLPGMTLEVKP